MTWRDFLGCHLTEPKAHVVFSRPARPLSPRAFAARAARHGVRLALPTRMLFRGRTFFINGEARPTGAAAARLLSRLADRRSLPPRVPPRPRIGAAALPVVPGWIYYVSVTSDGMRDERRVTNDG